MEGNTSGGYYEPSPKTKGNGMGQRLSQTVDEAKRLYNFK